MAHKKDEDICAIGHGRPQFRFTAPASPVVSRRRNTKTQSTQSGYPDEKAVSDAATSTTISDREMLANRKLSSDEIERYVLSGKTERLPPMPSKTVRIFMSSTFTDMTTERNVFFKKVYPKLQSYCRTKWDVDFQVVDMRWGVPSGATLDHSGSKLCMAELKVCQEESLGPNFVLLLGQRYGARPLPLNIDENEFGKLVDVLKGMSTPSDEMKRLNTWYMADENAEPLQRVLQPIINAAPECERIFTETTEPKLKRIIRAAADECLRLRLIDATSHHRYFRSVTDEEVFNGILNVENPNDHCLCFVRKISSINMDHEKAGRFIDKQENGQLDQESQNLLESLEKKVYGVLGKENIVGFAVSWSDNEGINENDHKEYLEDLCNIFYAKLVTLIDKAALSDQLQLKIIQSPLLNEIAEHSYEAKSKSATVSCHAATKKIILDYIDSDERAPLIVYGESGSGKTSLMAMASSSVSLWINGQSEVQVIRRFLGITTSSTYIESLLRGIADQIVAYWHIRPPIVDDPLDLLEILFKSLPRNARLILFLDSLDRLSPAGKAHTVCWLPLLLPSNVKVVLSCLPSEFAILDTLRSRSYPSSAFVPVKILDTTSSLNLLVGLLGSVHRTVKQEQMELIVSRLNWTHPQGTPLFIKLLFNILRSTPSYMNIYTFTERFHNLHDSSDCIRLIFTDLRNKHGHILVDTAFAFLHLSHQGLAENEIVDLLSLDETVLNNVFQFHMPPMRRLPAVLWKRIRHDVIEYIVERDVAGAKVLSWFDRKFSDVVQEMIISQCPASRIRELQTIMVEYFMGSWAQGRLKPFTYTTNMVKKLRLSSDRGEADRFVPEQPNRLSNGKPNMRKLTQLPRLLIATQMCDVFIYEILGSIDVLTGLFEIYTWSEIGEMTRNFAAALPDHDRVMEFVFSTIASCLLLCSATATTCPSTLAPLLAGRLLPLYGAASAIDRLLEDIYTKGISRNALVVHHNQLEGLGSYLLFELTNHHLGPCQRMRMITNKNADKGNYLISISKKATLVNLNQVVVSMSFAPRLRSGDQFNLLASSESSNSEYVAASLKDIPKVYVFSVKRNECTGNFDCRTINGFQDFVIYDMMAFSVAGVEVAAVWGPSFHGILLYTLKECELLYRFCNGRRVLAVVHYGTSLQVIQPGQVLQLLLKPRGGTVKVIENKKRRLSIPNSLVVTSKHTSPNSKLVAFGTSDGKVFTWPVGSPFVCRTVLDAAAHCLTIRDEESTRRSLAYTHELIACTRNSVYGILCIEKRGRSLPCVTWRIRRRFDWAGCLGRGPGITGYRHSSISVLELTEFQWRLETDSCVEVYEYLTFAGHAKQITDIIVDKFTSAFLTSSADGTIRFFNPCRKINPYVADVAKFDRMDVRINAIYGSGLYALTIAKDNRIVAVWSLASGKILHKLFHEGSHDLKDAIVLGECVVTADTAGLISVWNLSNTNVIRPVAEVNAAEFHTMVAKSETELIILAKQAVTELCLPTGTIVVTKPLQTVGVIVCSCWCPGSVYFVDGIDHPSLNLISDSTYIHERLDDGGCLVPFGSVVTGLHCNMSILAISFAYDIVFYNVSANCVLASMPIKRPVLLKSHSSVVAAQSGLTVQFFDMGNGVTKMGSLKLASTKDSAAISPDGQHCLVTGRPKMLHLYRISDLSEAGVYSCYSDIECAIITSDSKHVLVGMSDMRLLIFLVVDCKYKGHLDRAQGILKKPSNLEDQELRLLLLSAAANQDNPADLVFRRTFVTRGYVKEDVPQDMATMHSKNTFLKPTNLNCIQLDQDTNEVRVNLLLYAEHIASSVWKRQLPRVDLLRNEARIVVQ